MIGCGQMGFIHIQKLLENPNIKRISVVDTNAFQLEQAKLFFKNTLIQYYEKIDEALIDIPVPAMCVIASNTAYHSGNLLRVILQYKNETKPPLLFIEKPLVASLEELNNIAPQLREYKGYVVGGYLLRCSPVFKMVLDYLSANHLTINSIDINWIKKREPTRASAGVLTDETTHSFDLIFSYLLPKIGFPVKVEQIQLMQLEGIHSNTVVDIEKQKALYNTLVPAVLADVQYKLMLCGNDERTIIITGHSSFMSPTYDRTIIITCCDGTLVQCSFDINKMDHFSVIKDDKRLRHDSISCDKVRLELDDAIALQLGRIPATTPAGLDDMTKDIQLTTVLEKKIVEISKQTKEGEQFMWCADDLDINHVKRIGPI